MSLNNIYANNFYDKGPIPLWSFAVDFDIKTPSLSETELFKLSKAIQNCQFGERGVQTQDIFFNGFKRAVPTMATTDGTLNLTFNENTNLDITKIVSKIYKYSYNDLATSQDYFQLDSEDTDSTSSDTYDYRTTQFEPFKVNLKIYKPTKCALALDSGDNDDFLLKVVYYNCTITKINNVEFDYAKDTDVMTVQTEIHYDYMRALNV